MEGVRSSSTRSATARCCRSCISTATRSPGRRCSVARPTTTVLALLAAHGWAPVLVEGDEPDVVHRPWPTRSTPATATSGGSRSEPGPRVVQERPRWPAIVLRTPKGWTGPDDVDGVQVEGTFRAHQVPLSRSPGQPRAPRDARGAGCGRYRPERAVRRGRRAARPIWPRSRRRVTGAWAPRPTPTAAGCSSRSTFPPLRVLRPRLSTRRATLQHETDPAARRAAARSLPGEPPTAGNFRLFCPDETNSNRLRRGLRGDRPVPASSAGQRRGRPRLARTAGSWRCCPSTCARAGWRATC